MLTQQVHIALHLAQASPKAVVFTLKRMILPHHTPQLLLQLLISPQPILVDHRSIDIHRHLDGYLNSDFHFAFDLNWTVDIDGLIDEYRLVDDDGLMVYGPVHVNWFLDYFLHLHLLHDQLGDLLLYLDVLGHLDDLLHNPLRARHISRHLNLHLNRPLNHQLLHRLLWRFPCRLLQCFVLHFQPILLSLETRDRLLMILTGQIATTQMRQLQSKPHSFPFTLGQLSSKVVHLPKKFLQTFLIAFSFKHDLDLLIATARGLHGRFQLKFIPLPGGYSDRNKGLYFLQTVGCLKGALCTCRPGMLKLIAIFLLDYDRRLQVQCLPG